MEKEKQPNADGHAHQLLQLLGGQLGVVESKVRGADVWWRLVQLVILQACIGGAGDQVSEPINSILHPSSLPCACEFLIIDSFQQQVVVLKLAALVILSAL